MALLALAAMVVLVSPASSAAPQAPPCPETYCVTLTAAISIGGSGALTLTDLLASTFQVLAVAVLFTPGLALLTALRRRLPTSLLGMMAHLMRLSSPRTRTGLCRSSAYWLPIESTSLGRIRSSMVKSASLFGPGRLAP
jgi:hypothetical protein